MKKNLILIASLLFAVSVVFTGCQDSSGDPRGRLSIKVTDAPFPIKLIDEATVTITRVELRSENESEENPFITVWEGEKEFNLLDLRNGVVEELAEVEVPAGSYKLIRIYVSDAGIVVMDEISYSVKVPSGSQTGIKMFIAPSLQVSGGLTAEVLLDFNLEKSFVLKGNIEHPEGIKGFNFKPVIRAVNVSTAGTIYGKVSDSESPLEGAEVSITLEEVPTTTSTDEDGYYAFSGVPAGSYSLSASSTGYTSLTVDNVEVVEGNKTEQNFVLEAEEAAPAE